MSAWTSGFRIQIHGLTAAATVSFGTVWQRRGLLLGLVLFSACGSDGPQESEDYGDLLNSPAGLIVTQEEHPTGYSRPDCFACHEIRSMHAVNRTGLPSCSATVTQACLDLPSIRALTKTQGETSCAQCHGANGVQP